MIVELKKNVFPTEHHSPSHIKSSKQQHCSINRDLTTTTLTRVEQCLAVGRQQFHIFIVPSNLDLARTRHEHQQHRRKHRMWEHPV